jgi:hypothetical protein
VDGLTQRALADGIGKAEDNVSKLLAGPRNWTLKTISDLAGALKLDFEFALVDRTERCRIFYDTGMREVPSQDVQVANVVLHHRRALRQSAGNFVALSEHKHSARRPYSGKVYMDAVKLDQSLSRDRSTFNYVSQHD